MSDEEKDEGILPDSVRRVLFPSTIIGRIGRDIGAVVTLGLLVGLILFSVAGTWPPVVSVLSGSMEPNINEGELVFITSPEKTSTSEAHGATGVVPLQEADQFRSFGMKGHVVVYYPDGKRMETPIIHRAHIWVNEGENWYDDANKDYVGEAQNCEQLPNCPAPNKGFITKGDANGQYDQVAGFSRPVKPDWIKGVAKEVL